MSLHKCVIKKGIIRLKDKYGPKNIKKEEVIIVIFFEKSFVAVLSDV